MQNKNKNKNKNKKEKLLIVGYGAMGKALCESWQMMNNSNISNNINGNMDVEISVVSPHAPIDSGNDLGGDSPIFFYTPDTLPDIKFDYVVLAIKPQIFDKALPFYKRNICANGSTVISIAAGVTIDKISDLLGGHERIVRVMPNTPARVGQGVSTVYFANKKIDAKARSMVNRLLNQCSKVVVELNSEDEFHMVTGVIGSGPAYIFYLMECFVDSLNCLNIDTYKKRLMVEQLVAGSAIYSMKSFESEGKSLKDLRDEVTSPNGTTEAGLNVLMNNSGTLRELLLSTVDGAAKRSQELSEEN